MSSQPEAWAELPGGSSGTFLLTHFVLGIKEYSDWPTVPQLYVDKEFVGGCDILVSMHQNGELSKLLDEKKVLAPDQPAEAAVADEKKV